MVNHAAPVVRDCTDGRNLKQPLIVPNGADGSSLVHPDANIAIVKMREGTTNGACDKMRDLGFPSDKDLIDTHPVVPKPAEKLNEEQKPSRLKEILPGDKGSDQIDQDQLKAWLNGLGHKPGVKDLPKTDKDLPIEKQFYSWTMQDAAQTWHTAHTSKNFSDSNKNLLALAHDAYHDGGEYALKQLEKDVRSGIKKDDHGGPKFINNGKNIELHNLEYASEDQRKHAENLSPEQRTQYLKEQGLVDIPGVGLARELSQVLSQPAPTTRAEELAKDFEQAHKEGKLDNPELRKSLIGALRNAYAIGKDGAVTSFLRDMNSKIDGDYGADISFDRHGATLKFLENTDQNAHEIGKPTSFKWDHQTEIATKNIADAIKKNGGITPEIAAEIKKECRRQYDKDNNKRGSVVDSWDNVADFVDAVDQKLTDQKQSLKFGAAIAGGKLTFTSEKGMAEIPLEFTDEHKSGEVYR